MMMEMVLSGFKSENCFLVIPGIGIKGDWGTKKFHKESNQWSSEGKVYVKRTDKNKSMSKDVSSKSTKKQFLNLHA